MRRPSLWELGEGEWLRVIRLSEYAPRRPLTAALAQVGLKL